MTFLRTSLALIWHLLTSRQALLMLSGGLIVALEVWYVWPLCSVGAYFAGIFTALIAMGATLFVEAGLDYLKEDR